MKENNIKTDRGDRPYWVVVLLAITLSVVTIMVASGCCCTSGLASGHDRWAKRHGYRDLYKQLYRKRRLAAKAAKHAPVAPAPWYVGADTVGSR